MGNLAEFPTIPAAMIIVAFELSKRRPTDAGGPVEPTQRRAVEVEIEEDTVADLFRGAAVIPVGQRAEMKLMGVARDMPGAGGQDR